MFDIGALELLIIGVVALLVGPERLPKLARTAGRWVGRARRALSSVKDEIDREIKAEELKEILRKQSQSNPLETILEDDTAAKPHQHTPQAPGGGREAGDAQAGLADTEAGGGQRRSSDDRP
jgi:sec-independent protein translocase protein TatB